MTTKYFKKIAEILKLISDKQERQQAAQGFMDMAMADNKRFDPKKFLAACGLE